MNERNRAILKILLFASLVVVGNLLASWFIERLDFEITPATQPAIHQIIAISMVAYTILVAVPFVPGAEIGLAVLMVLGPKMAGLVYVCTLTSLCLSFLVGRFIPERTLINIFRGFHFDKASELTMELEGLNPRQRLGLILGRSPRKIVPFLLRHRYLAIVIAINLPGNIIIGGGGGIALMAGLSRLFSPAAFILAVAIAVSPIPLFLIVFGGNLADWPL